MNNSPLIDHLAEAHGVNASDKEATAILDVCGRIFVNEWIDFLVEELDQAFNKPNQPVKKNRFKERLEQALAEQAAARSKKGN